ncbi:MAG TPA: DUF2202 domain-containing protein [Thermotogota bacterium]|nr:DUF2202 domain-containing protein [Thermotogota bacterium]HPJ90107.1 DUF2202 domain-containing protein [Thermotogota bacterium]
MKKFVLTFVLITMISLSALFAATLSEEDIQQITWVREEEKLARDVYLTLYELWGIKTFSNIAESEQNHMDAIRDELIVPNGIEDPVKTEAVGVFTNPDIQTLYDQLIETGSASIQDAITIGLMIEDMDIFDLEEVIASIDDTTVQEVMNNLQDGSENHMRAFDRQADKYGVVYEAAYITQEEMDAILAGSNGNGNQENQSQAQGYGQGHAQDNSNGKGNNNTQTNAHGNQNNSTTNNRNNGQNSTSTGNGNSGRNNGRGK